MVKKMLNKNKGFSLIEIILTITILAIVSSGILVLSKRIAYADTIKAAKTVDSVMGKLRLETMSKDTKQYLYLYNIDGTIYIKVSDFADSASAGLNMSSGKKIAGNMTVYIKEIGELERTLSNGENIAISFVRSSGAFLSNMEYIKFTYSDSTSILTCIKETGRHWAE